MVYVQESGINLVGQMKIMDELNIKVNYSALAKQYGVDRHTIARIHKNKGVPLRKGRPKKSSWDDYEEIILEKMKLPGVTNRGIFQFLKRRYPDIKGTYSGFNDYLRRKGMHRKQTDIPHMLYETDPGEQLQADWKEDLSIRLKNGTVVQFNVFSATLGYSREHVFLYSPSKTEDDFIRCTLEAYRRLGGVTKVFKTDNMSAIVSVRGKNKTIHPRIVQFFKDLDVQLELCEVRTPETKGKDENANKFMNRLIPYNDELHSVDELIELIETTITADSNNQINTGTQLPPVTLFAKEKEYLRPLSNAVMLDSYLRQHFRERIDATMLFYYNGSRYSVPSSCINETVDIYIVENSIHVYLRQKLVTVHTISQKRVNYDISHYSEGFQKRFGKRYSEDEIEEMAKANLERFDKKE